MTEFDNHNQKYQIPPFHAQSGIHDVALILSAGTSSRFCQRQPIPKQLHPIKIRNQTRPALLHVINSLRPLVRNVVIVTNTQLYPQVSALIAETDDLQIQIVINDVNCRLQSIQVGLQAIDQLTEANHVIIHDSARPYVSQGYFQHLLTQVRQQGGGLAQSYLQLTNGLLWVSDQGQYQTRNRDHYRELCTPICGHFSLLKYIFTHYLDPAKRLDCEFLPIVQAMKLPCQLVVGSWQQLRKITLYEDIDPDLDPDHVQEPSL